jgi:hypothetical protein
MEGQGLAKSPRAHAHAGGVKGDAGDRVPAPVYQERFTVPVKPFWGVMVKVVVPLDPCWTVRLVGLREMVKSGGLEHAVRTAPRTSRARIKAFLITPPPLKP